MTEVADPRTKICSKCGIEKPRSDFYARKDRPCGIQGYCKSCANNSRWKVKRTTEQLERARISNRESYRRNRSAHLTRANTRNSQYKIKALQAHGSMCCQRCDYDDHPAALEFHHRDPSTKLFNIANAAIAPDKYPWNDLLQEILKCDVICANCHKIEHSSPVYGEVWNEIKE